MGEVSSSTSDSTQTMAFSIYAYRDREDSLAKKAQDFRTLTLDLALPISEGVPVAGAPKCRAQLELYLHSDPHWISSRHLHVL